MAVYLVQIGLEFSFGMVFLEERIYEFGFVGELLPDEVEECGGRLGDALVDEVLAWPGRQFAQKHADASETDK